MRHATKSYSGSLIMIIFLNINKQVKATVTLKYRVEKTSWSLEQVISQVDFVVSGCLNDL